MNASTINDPKKWIINNQEKIFEFYLKQKIQNKLIKSPFRKDENPTCGYYYGKTGRLYLHDFRTEFHYDAIEIVKKRFNLTFTSAINRIIEDAHLITQVDEGKLKDSAKELSWIPEHKGHPYFKQYHIPDSYLEKYKVFTAKAVYTDQVMWGRSTSKNPIFIYALSSGHIKVYRPLTKEKDKKWYGNLNAQDIFGLDVLPYCGQTLIVSSSLKDVMVLKLLGFNAVAFNGEGYGTGKLGTPSRTVVEDTVNALSKRFEHIIFFMDNDKAGLEYNQKLSSIYKKKNMALPAKYPKDISDCIKKYGVSRTRRVLKKLLSKLFNQNGKNNDLDLALSIPYYFPTSRDLHGESEAIFP